MLFPDSFRSRGREEICTIENRQRTITRCSAPPRRAGRARVSAGARRTWRPSASRCSAGRMAEARCWRRSTREQPAVAAWKDRAGSPPYFRAGVAFYPGCIESLRARDGYAVAAPLTLFVGGADDWTAPQPCIDLADRLAAAGEPVTITVYPGHLPRLRRSARRRDACGSTCRTASIRARRDGRAQSRRARRRLREAQALSARGDRRTAVDRDAPSTDSARIAGRAASARQGGAPI